MSARIGELAFRLVLCAIALIATVALAGCNDYSNPASAAGVQLASASSFPAVGPRTYVLRPNDQIRLQIYGETNVSGVYTIDGGGAVSIPLAGRIHAAGLTAAELERTIRKRLNGTVLTDPHVNVQVATYGPIYIRGEVKQPGQFPYVPGLTIGDAVALAGGYTYRADETTAYVRPANSGREMARSLRTDVPVSPGDSIRIPESYF